MTFTEQDVWINNKNMYHFAPAKVAQTRNKIVLYHFLSHEGMLKMLILKNKVVTERTAKVV